MSIGCGSGIETSTFVWRSQPTGPGRDDLQGRNVREILALSVSDSLAQGRAGVSYRKSAVT